MGEVFAARILGAEGFVKDVALKRIYPHLAGSQKHRQLFVREAKIVAQLSHPNIVQVLELGNDGDDLFMAMEFVSGITLSQVLRRFNDEGRKLPFQIVVAIANDLLEALAYAHDYNDASLGIRGIIHADVSPQNVMLTQQGRAKLCDFGVAKLLRFANQEATQRERWGKVAYMAPEAVNDTGLDARSDIYAVAIMMFEAISGQRVFSANNAGELARAVVRGERPSFYAVATDTPVEIAAVIERGCAVDPAMRFHSAAAMRRALLDAAGTESIEDSRQWLSGMVADSVSKDTSHEGTHSSQPTALTSSDTSVDRPSQRTWKRAALGATAGALLATIVTMVGLMMMQGGNAPDPEAPILERVPPEPLPVPDNPLADATPVDQVPRDEGDAHRPAPRRAAKTTPKTSTQKPALLTLNSVPWAYVVLDGQRLPKPTPLFDYALEPGQHTIQLRAANGKTQSLSLNLQPGEVVRRVVRLE